MEERVYIIVLNYKGWQDTIACLESLFKLTYSNYQIIVVDNCSPDDSASKLIDWSVGSVQATVSEVDLSSLITPPCQKPIDYALYTEDQPDLYRKRLSQSGQLTFITAKANKGFSAGNNIGIRFAIAQGDASYYWLLNNDTLVRPDTLSELIGRFKALGQSHKIGIVGGRLMYYHNPGVIQCLGGATYNAYLGVIKQVGNGLPYTTDLGLKDLDLAYVSGACMLVSNEFIKDIGILDESYFLYYEEIDWCTRGKLKGWGINCSLRAVVYHREGATSGSNTLFRANRSDVADYFFTRSKLIFTKKYMNSICQVSIRIGIFGSILQRLLNGDFHKATVILKSMFEK